MIETTEAVASMDEILSVPGVDVLLVGPSDLSITHDMPTEYTNPKYIALLERITATCRRHGVAAGIYFAPPGLEPTRLQEIGFSFIGVPWVGWARKGIKTGLSAL